MPKTFATAGTVLALALLITGCSAPAPQATAPAQNEEPPAPKETSEEPAFSFETAAATGVEISGTGYTYRAPAGWEIPPAQEGYTPDSLVGNPADADGFVDNVNVVVTPGVRTVDEIDQTNEGEVTSAGANAVEIREHERVAGAETSHVTSQFSEGDLVYVLEQYGFSSAENTYVMTFSFSYEVLTVDRLAIVESVLASWTWV